MNRTIEQWAAINQYAFACNASFGDVRDIVEQAVSDLQELARQRDELLNMFNEIEDGDLLYILGIDNFNRYVDILRGDS